MRSPTPSIRPPSSPDIPALDPDSTPRQKSKKEFVLPQGDEEMSPNLLRTIKLVVLLGVCLQNAGQALMTRYSRGVLKESYSSTEVVMMSEMIKMLVSAYLTLASKEDSNSIIGTGMNKLYWLMINSKGMILLVVLYSAANLLQFYALGKIEASLFSVLTQLKTLTTAAFSILILSRVISLTKWRALVLLVIGCILVASPTFNKAIDCSRKPEEYAEKDKLNILDSMLGIGACCIIVTTSGFCSVYLESLLKQSEVKLGIWHRNFQLAFWSVAFLLITISYEAFTVKTIPIGKVTTLFSGWTVSAVIITLLNAGGGLLVAATLKYADSILKTLAISGSIVLSAILGWMLLGGQLDIFVSLGCVSTIIAIFNYTFDTST